MLQQDIDAMLESMPRIRINTNLVFGVAKNDSKYKTSIKHAGADLKHSAYVCWNNMLRRCYSLDYQEQQPTYIGCTVCNEWLSFSYFKLWWDHNHKYGWHLDKDIILAGNTIYSPDRCVFIPQKINSFVTERKRFRGDFMIGVNFDKKSQKFRSQISSSSKRLPLGFFDDPISAHKAWYKKKIELAYEHKETCDSIHPDLFSGLLRKIESMKEF